MRTMIATVCAVTTLTTLAGCSLLTWVSKEDSGHDTEQVGSLVSSWSQAEHEISGLKALTDDTTVLTTEAERDAWLAEVPKTFDSAPVAEVDLSKNLLVVGGYSTCMEEGRVLTDPDKTGVWFTTYIAPEDRNTNCDWSPYTVEVWRVPLGEVGD